MSTNQLPETSTNPLPASWVALDGPTRKLITEVRPLRHYKLHFMNERYPILSFLYAVLAGGEHTLYCDHTEDYVKAYLTGPHREEMRAILYRYEQFREKNPPIVPPAEDWDEILAVLKKELTDQGVPLPLW
jgi:hypothetical protein